MRTWQTLVAAACALGASTTFADERAAVAEKYKWNLAEIYPTEKAWDEERQAIGA